MTRPIWYPTASLLRVSFLAASLLLDRTASASLLDGVWQSQGYGYVFEIQGPDLKSFEVTSTTCVLGFTARLQKVVTPGREATFKTSEKDLFFIRSSKSNPESGEKRLHFEGSASDLLVHRVQKVPRVCETPSPNTPAGNFEVFARTFDEQYISFGLKHANWKKIVADNRPKVISQITPTQLFDILQAMIEPFHDAHTAISAPSLKREFEGFRPGGYQLAEGKSESRFKKREMPILLGVTERAYLDGPLKKLCNGQLQYGHIGKTTGYLRILAEGGYTRRGGPAADLAALNKALDNIFSDPALEALVLDLRINFGGSDQLGLAIASRLATDEYSAFIKYARLYSADRDGWTAGQVSRVRPSPRPGFRGPVVELIGPLTISAGETFTQALMGRTPHVTRIGENSQGVFSDVLDRHLPNGWSFGLPNEVFRTSKGTAFDGVGIPPDIRVPIFAEADVMAGKDPALTKAVEILNKAVDSSRFASVKRPDGGAPAGRDAPLQTVTP